MEVPLSAQPERKRRGARGSLPFFLVHAVAAVGVIATGWSWSGFGLAVLLYLVRMFFVSGGFHRYFAHRTYKTSRAFQLVLAVLGTTTGQQGALWWSARHRHHHKHSDQPEDLHSPRQKGFAWAHYGWFLGDDLSEDDLKRVPDLAKFPELVWVERRYHYGLVIMALALLAIGGWHACLWGFFVSTVLLWHATFTINSLSHVMGKRPFATTDDSRNHWLLALITLGEGWHNNHHYYQSSERQGFYWWQIDISHGILRMLSWVGLVWDLRSPPESILALGRRGAAALADRTATHQASEPMEA